MFLSEYIKALQDIQTELGDTELLFTAADDEGNSYNLASYAPEIRYLSPHEREYRPENLIALREEGETQEEWLDNNCLDEEDIPNLKKVVLL